jgi:hypothetical protein
MTNDTDLQPAVAAEFQALALRGPAEDLALVLCGRAVPPERLEGRPL